MELFSITDEREIKNDNDGHKNGQRDVLDFGADSEEFLKQQEDL